MTPIKPVQSLLDLTGRAAIVTGGAAGIGFGIARRLGEAGAAVLVADLDLDAAQRAAKALREDGYRAEAAAVDVGEEASVRDMVAHACRELGGIDILVNNAGIYPNVSLAQLDASVFDRIVAVNLRGVFLCTKHVSEVMKIQGRGGQIVNITSIDALHPSMVGLATYDATKHGAWGFTKNVALELARYGIQVNAVAPGGIMTQGTQAATGSGGSAGETTDMSAMVESFTAGIPMRRMGEPDEVGKVVLFLVSDMASYMTGSQVVVDGGALLG